MDLEIFIIDDNDIVLYLHDIELQEQFPNAVIHKHYSAEDALEYLNNQQSSSLIIIFLDINMPCMSGWDFIEEIQQHPDYQNMYIFVVTSSIDYKDKDKSTSYSQVMDFYEKPLNAATCASVRLIPALANYL